MYPSISPFARLRLLRAAGLLVILSLLAFPGIGQAGQGSPAIPASLPAADTSDAIYSQMPNLPPRIDGQVSDGEWGGAGVASLPDGRLSVLNDLIALYVLVDLPAGTGPDTPGSLSLAFDTNAGEAVNPGIDLQFAYPTNSNSACLYRSGRPDMWTDCQQTGSIFRAGWGPTPASAAPHRFYEIAVSLAEVSPSAARTPMPDIPDFPSTLQMATAVTASGSTPSDLLQAAKPSDFSSSLTVHLSLSEIRLLVLGHPDDIDALKVFKAHKDYTAMPSYLLDWMVVAQLNQSVGYDDPERIKKALAAYEKYSHIAYALLVGDANRFPMRYTITDREDENHRAHWAFYSADLYYADLYEADHTTFETWDANNDHYYGELHGEQLTGVLNFDQVDLTPDIAVGRVPASDTAEVVTFVNKVINYEYNAYHSTWHKQALMIATMDWVADACATKEYIRTNMLVPHGYTVGELYQAGNPCLAVNPPTQANINSELNKGYGFVNYNGHGNRWGWAIPGYGYTDTDLASLSNQNMLPITVATGCDTARYTTQPPYDPYVDVNGTPHTGANAGEVFPAKPPQPSSLQAANNLDAFAEEMLVKRSTGAVAYVGFVTGSQPWSQDLDKAFFDSIAYNRNTLGGMWNFMVERYYQWHPDPGSLAAPDWYVVAGFHQPWKFHLFGDPSLRIHGVSRFQKADFAGAWTQNHDGWTGTLSLEPALDNWASTPNMTGTYVGGMGSRAAYGFVRTWSFPIAEDTDFPDYKMQFFIDFNNNTDTSDDQKFDGYLFTHDRNKMAGVTWWNGTPFGFYATKSAAAGRTKLEFEAARAPGVLPKSSFLGAYAMNHDGWVGRLTLYDAGDHPPDPNITGAWRDTSGHTHAVTAYVRTTTYPLPSAWGPDHKIEIYIDFNDTPSTGDDQKFEGYLFTQTGRAIAGLTWWNSNPFGFYATKGSSVYLPFVRK